MKKLKNQGKVFAIRSQSHSPINHKVKCFLKSSGNFVNHIISEIVKRIQFNFKEVFGANIQVIPRINEFVKTVAVCIEKYTWERVENKKLKKPR